MHSLLSTIKLLSPYLSVRYKIGLLLYSIVLFTFSLLDLLATLLLSVAIYSISGSQTPLELSVFGINITSLVLNANLDLQNLFLGAGCLIIVKSILNVVATRFLFQYLARVQQSLTSRVTKLIQMQSYEVVKKINYQEAVNAMTAGMNSIIVGIVGQGISLLSEFFLITILALSLISIDFMTFGAIFLYFVPFSILMVRITSKRVEKLGNEMVTSDVRCREVLTDTLHLWRELKTSKLIDGHLRYFLESSRNLSNSFARSNWFQSIPKYFMEILSLLSLITFWYFANINHTNRESIAMLFVFIAFSSRTLPSLLRLQNSFIAMRNCEGNAHYALGFLKMLNSVLRVDGSSLQYFSYIKKTPHATNLILEMQDVSFKYFDSESPILSGIDFELRAGEKVALFGNSGSGKSTFCDLLCGFLQPSSGKISRLENSQEKEMEIGFLPQEVFLMSANFIDNIVLHRNFSPNTEQMNAIMTAINSAELGNFVASLPNGLYTRIGNSHIGLSGGQKQRIGIARSIYKNSDLLVMDEPGSSLDGETEELILTALKNLGEERALVYISHRPASLKYFSKIVFFDTGKIRGIGSFSELYRSNSRFREIVDASKFNT